MVRKSVLLASTALAGLMTAHGAVAQPARSLEDRVRALEQLLGQSPNTGANPSLEARVEALEAQIQQRVMEDDCPGRQAFDGRSGTRTREDRRRGGGRAPFHLGNGA